MRRFSQRNNLVTLSDINITPLLDLAFVLLIIFIITTPMLTQSIDLKLPQGGRPDARQVNPGDRRTVEITADGKMRYETRPTTIDQIEREVVLAAKSNPNLVVDIRADKEAKLQWLADVYDIGVRNNIHFVVRWRTEPRRR